MGTTSKEQKKGIQEGSRASFNSSVRVEKRNEHLTGELGVLALRELDDRLGLCSKLASSLYDPRDQKYVTHPIIELLRTRIYSIIQGWGDQDDVDHLRNEPSFRLGVSERKGDSSLRAAEDAKQAGPDGLSSQPTISRMNTFLSEIANRKQLLEALLDWTDKSFNILGRERLKTLTADVDSTIHPTAGFQAGTSYNGHYGANGYHPQLVYLHETRTWIGAELRMGAEHSSTGVKDLMLPLLKKLHKKYNILPRVRGDAAYVSEEFLHALEEYTDGDKKSPISYCFRLKANSALSTIASPFTTLPSGPRPKDPRIWLAELTYKAETWTCERRVVLIIKEVPDELYPDYFFLVTNFDENEYSAEKVWEYYKQRGEMEADIGQLKTVLRPHLSSTDRVSLEKKETRSKEESELAEKKAAIANETTLFIFLLAYNLMRIGSQAMNQIFPEMNEAQSGHVRDEARPLKEKKRHYGWSLQRFRERVLKCAGRIILGKNIVRVVVAESGKLWQCFWNAVCATPILQT